MRGACTENLIISGFQFTIKPIHSRCLCETRMVIALLVFLDWTFQMTDTLPLGFKKHPSIFKMDFKATFLKHDFKILFQVYLP